MSMLADRLKQRQLRREQQHLSRSRPVIHHQKNNRVLVDGKTYIDFSNNDYLGLSHHPDIASTFQEGINQFGVGGSSSSIVSGYSPAQHEFEQAFADWLRMDRAILFNSGYHANLGLYSALCERHDRIYADRLCHASILDGIQLSRAKLTRYQHNDMQHLELLIQKNTPDWIVSESVFSMEGDVAPIGALSKITKAHTAQLIIDDAHGIGVLGDGRGIISSHHLTQNDIACLVAPLGKAFHGIGAIVAGKKTIIDELVQSARSYHYSTALPPALCCAMIKTLKIIQQDTWRREKLMENIVTAQTAAKKYDINLLTGDKTPIISIIIGDNKKTQLVKKELLARGFFVSAIRPPTVKKGSARLRLSLNSSHTKEEINRLVQIVREEIK